jgi:hypothetical protein
VLDDRGRRSPCSACPTPSSSTTCDLGGAGPIERRAAEAA